jgi:predicted kinase
MQPIKSTPRLILFAGHAGTGKTSLAKKALPLIAERTGEDFFFLDKDTVYGAFSSHVMGLLTGDPDDRDSPTYLQNIRDQEYAGLIDIVRENFSLNVNVILVGPFTRELMAGKFFHPSELGLPASTTCRIAWIDLDSEVARQRIEHRADARDAYKLAHWETYLQRRVEPPVHHHLYRFNNLEPTETEFQALLAHLIS